MKSAIAFSRIALLTGMILLMGGTIYAQDVLGTMPNAWTVTECCGWTGIWQRRPGTNTYDANWTHTNGTTARDVLEFSAYNAGTMEVTILRRSLNGQYKAKYDANAKTLTNGTATWYPAGAGWSAKANLLIGTARPAQGSDPLDEKGEVKPIRRR